MKSPDWSVKVTKGWAESLQMLRKRLPVNTARQFGRPINSKRIQNTGNSSKEVIFPDFNWKNPKSQGVKEKNPEKS